LRLAIENQEIKMKKAFSENREGDWSKSSLRNFFRTWIWL